MRIYEKASFPVDKVRRFLEPGPIVLVTSAHRGERNVMTMGWHMVMEFSPSRLGFFVTSANHSYELIRKSRACVINVPTYDLLDVVVGVGNCSGRDVDKFGRFGLTPEPAKKVSAPLLAECFASFECVVTDTSLLRKYGMFVAEVAHAHVARSPKYPKTVHYRGDGVFMVSGENVSRRRKFRPENL